MSKLVDLKGKRFGILTVIEPAGTDRFGHKIWKCKCDCGVEKNIKSSDLVRGSCKSCGCLRPKLVSMVQFKHGEGHTKLYGVWYGIKERCFCKTFFAYDRYGGRGITMCKEWADDFLIFKKWALENGYEEGLTIDRIDNDGDYCPENCRWTDMKVQSNNRRSNHLITLNGETHTIAEWEHIMGLKRIVQSRLSRGWSEYDAIMTPSGKKHI